MTEQSNNETYQLIKETKKNIDQFAKEIQRLNKDNQKLLAENMQLKSDLQLRDAELAGTRAIMTQQKTGKLKSILQPVAQPNSILKRRVSFSVPIDNGNNLQLVGETAKVMPLSPKIGQVVCINVIRF